MYNICNLGYAIRIG